MVKLPKLLCQIAFHGLILATWPMQSFKIMSIDFLSLEVIHLRHPQKMTKLVISLSPSEKRAINILFKKTESAKRCQVSRPSPIPVPFGSHKCMVLYWNVFFISTEQCWERKTCQRVCNICFTGLLQTKRISHKAGFGLFAWISFQENPRKKNLCTCFNKSSTAWKVFLFGVFLVRIFPHLGWIRTRKIPNTDTFHAV